MPSFDPFGGQKTSWCWTWKGYSLHKWGEQFTAHTCLPQPYLFSPQKTRGYFLLVWWSLCSLTRLLWTCIPLLFPASHQSWVSTKQNLLKLCECESISKCSVTVLQFCLLHSRHKEDKIKLKSNFKMAHSPEVVIVGLCTAPHQLQDRCFSS